MKKLILFFTLFTITYEKDIKGYCDIKGNIKKPGVYAIYENYTIQNIINDAGGLKKDSNTDKINLSKKVTDEMVIYINTNKEIKILENLKNCECKSTYKYIECETTTTKILETNKSTTTPITLQTTLKTNKHETTKMMSENTTTKLTSTTLIKTTEKTTQTPITSNKTTIQSESTTSIINEKLNINTCSLEELINIKGLGEIKAKAIIEYRNNKLFDNIEELMNVKGIGKTTFEKIKEYIKI